MITRDAILRRSRCIGRRGNSSNPLGRVITRVGSEGWFASGELFRVASAIASLEGVDGVVQRLEEPIGTTIDTKIEDIYCLIIDKGCLYCYRLFSYIF